jgi:hypothetical protein
MIFWAQFKDMRGIVDSLSGEKTLTVLVFVIVWGMKEFEVKNLD